MHSQQIVRYHMDHSEYDNIIETCKRFRNEPYLWVQALTYFAQREEDCKDHLIQVLDQIDEKNLIPPLLVSQECKSVGWGVFCSRSRASE